jgi:hypothetical protein
MQAGMRRHSRVCRRSKNIWNEGGHGVEIVYHPRLQSKIPAATMEKAKEADQQIIDGKIVLE